MGLRQFILSKPCSKHTLQGAGVDEDIFLQHLLVLELGSRMRTDMIYRGVAVSWEAGSFPSILPL